MMFHATDSFNKNFKKLSKDYHSLNADLERFKKALEIDGERLTGLKRIPLSEKISTKFFKARKFRCKSLNCGSMSGIRIVFCWQVECENIKIIFIEIYYKGKQENHNETKIIDFCKGNGLYVARGV